ncbi:hypothetical protein QYM36_009027 [Artemia franciscana]|uniref:Uncharacterized protein n=2 Tax=Artemia franciscana TaxID=6661 RepID=A0AA88LAY5_ARTSF|nr:hypothetical protein QYM36_009027 [Artemia franciscana]
MQTGLKVLVHDPLEIPDTTQHGFTVTAGQETYLLVRLTKIESSSAVKGIAFEKRHCCFNQDRNLKYFKVYTRSLCFYDCFSSFLERNGSCGCKPFYRSVPKNLPYCDIGSYKCIQSLEVQLLEDDSLCGCCVECNSLVYEYLTSYAAFPGYGYSNAPLPFKIAAQKNDSKYTKSEYVRNNLARIQINWAQQKVFGRKRSVRFTWEDLVASIGGLLGFGTGFSLLSGFEIVYFLFIRLTIRLLYASNS